MNEDTDINVCPDSENYSSTGILTSNDSGIIDGDGIKTELVSEISVSNKIGDDLSVNMTKNKDCEQQSQSEGDENISEDNKKGESVVEYQNSVEKVEDIESNETPSHSEDINVETLTEEKILQVTKEDSSKPPDYSFCEWSETYESLEDDRPMEEVAGKN